MRCTSGSFTYPVSIWMRKSEAGWTFCDGSFRWHLKKTSCHRSRRFPLTTDSCRGPIQRLDRGHHLLLSVAAYVLFTFSGLKKSARDSSDEFSLDWFPSSLPKPESKSCRLYAGC